MRIAHKKNRRLLHSRTLESLQAANRKNGESKTRRIQRAFADHLRHVGRVYPRDAFGRVVLLIDNAPWRRGKPIDGREPAPGVQAAAQLQPAAESHRAVLVHEEEDTIPAQGVRREAIRKMIVQRTATANDDGTGP